MPTRTLDWRNKTKWVGDIDKYAGEFLGARLKKRLQIPRPKVCWSDNLSWLPDPSIVVDVAMAFHAYYSHVKAFHGCRPVSVRSYYERGIRGQNEIDILGAFRNTFNDIDPIYLTRAIQEMASRGEQERGKSYFLCDDVELVETCGHYLIQGSEYLMALAACLCGQGFSSEDFRMRLRQIGIPTVFEADVPLSYVSPGLLDAFCRSIIAEWGRRATGSRSGGADAMCLILHEDLPPECIVGHRHPAKIPDPHIPYGIYTLKNVGCDAPRCG